MKIPNKYKDILDDLIDSSDIKSSDLSKLVDKGFHNTSRSEGCLIGLSKVDDLNEDVLDMPLGWLLRPKTLRYVSAMILQR